MLEVLAGLAHGMLWRTRLLLLSAAVQLWHIRYGSSAICGTAAFLPVGCIDKTHV